MAKLRKPRPSTSPAAETTRQRVRAPSIASTSSSIKRSSPIALRTANRKSLAAVSSPTLDAAGEFSPSGSGTSPISSPASSAATLAVTNSSAIVAPEPQESSFALAQLRQSLESDSHARSELATTPADTNKLKKLHPPRLDDDDDDDDDDEVHEAHEERLEGTKSESVHESTANEEEEEDREVCDNDRSDRSQMIEEEEEPKSSDSPTAQTTRPRPPPPPSSSLLFAPARLGWRVATGTVQFGLDTGKRVVRQVPIVGRRLVDDDDDVDHPHEQRAVEVEGLPSPRRVIDRDRDRDDGSCSEISFAPSTIEHDPSPVVGKESCSTGTAEEHGIVYRAAELSLGLGIASVLVTTALGRMAWRRVVSRTSSDL